MSASSVSSRMSHPIRPPAVAAAHASGGGSVSSSNIEAPSRDVPVASASAASSMSAPVTSKRAGPFSQEEIKRLVDTLLVYAREHGLPSQTKVAGAARTSSDKVIPVGWTTIANDMNTAYTTAVGEARKKNAPLPKGEIRDGGQIMRKFDNIKTETKQLYEFIRNNWTAIIQLAAEFVILTQQDDAPLDEVAELRDNFLQHYCHTSVFPFGWQYDEKDEPRDHVIDAVRARMPESKKNLWTFLLETIQPILEDINDVSSRQRTNKGQKETDPSERAKRRRENNFALSDEQRAHISMEINSPSESTTSVSSGTANDYERRRPRPQKKIDKTDQAIAALAESTRDLSHTIANVMAKDFEEKFGSFDVLMRKIRASDDEVIALSNIQVTELSDFLITEPDTLKRALLPISYERLKGITQNTTLKLP